MVSMALAVMFKWALFGTVAILAQGTHSGRCALRRPFMAIRSSSLPAQGIVIDPARAGGSIIFILASPGSAPEPIGHVPLASPGSAPGPIGHVPLASPGSPPEPIGHRVRRRRHEVSREVSPG